MMLPTSKKTRRDAVLIEAFYKSMARGDIPPGFSPTIGGALAWLSRHREELNTALRLVQMYPPLVKEECLDGLWNFFQPFLQQISAAGKGSNSQVQCKFCRTGKRGKLGGWQSVDEQSLAVRGGPLAAPVIKPSTSVHGVDTLGLKQPEAPRATSAKTSSTTAPRSAHIRRALSREAASFESMDVPMDTGPPNTNQLRATEQAPPRRTNSGGSTGDRSAQGSGHTSPDDASTDLPQKEQAEEVNLPPIANMQPLQKRLANRKQPLRRQASIGYLSDSRASSTKGTEATDSRMMTPSMSETAYLVFKRSLNGAVQTPELVRWPLKAPDARRDSWMTNFWEDDSDGSLALDANVNLDVDFCSRSTTPDSF